MAQKIVLLMGGVGNRLFQIARAYDLKQAGCDVITVDVERLPELNYLAGRWLGWTRHKLWIDIDKLTASLGLAHGSLPAFSRPALYVELARSRLLGQRNRFNLPLAKDRRRIQIGYFQAHDCTTNQGMDAVGNAVRHLLPVDNHKSWNAVIHVRGGDFAAEDRLSQEMIQTFQGQVDGNCVCVTNDAPYVLSMFPALAFAPSAGPADDFMTICRAGLIMASNSTFCFWASLIAVRCFNSTLWNRPADSYWRTLDSDLARTNG